MENIEIRKVGSLDSKKLQKISIQTFSETFSAANTAANMEKYLKENFSQEKLIYELNNKNSVFYFALLDNRIIGYLKLNFRSPQKELQDEKALEIQRIYVAKEFQGRKVGQLLYDKAVQVAQHIKAGYIWLGVWEKNIKALCFYQKNGFTTFDKHIFLLGDDQQIDLIMKKVL